MTYVYWYLAVSAVVVLILMLAERRSLPKSKNMDAVMLAAFPEQGSVWYRIRRDILVPVLSYIALVIAWPLAVLILMWDSVKKGDKPTPEDVVFSVLEANLLRPYSVEEVESIEAAFDPLAAAPRIPFGFFNEIWREFLRNLAPGDEIWAFCAKHPGRLGNSELKEGYVIVRAGVPGQYILTVSCQIEEDV